MSDEVIPFSGTDLNPRDRGDLPRVERHLLACCIRGDEGDWGIDDALEVVTPADFALPGHASVFAVCEELRREHRAVLAPDVCARLEELDAAAPHSVGLADLKPDPARWLAGTVELEPTGARAKYYARMVRDAALLRRLRAVVGEMTRDVAQPTGPAEEVIRDCESLLFQLTDSCGPKRETAQPVVGAMAEVLADIDARASGEFPAGLSTGYRDIDNVLGPLRPGHMVVIGARPGGGKTALSVCFAANAAGAGASSLFFSMEMPRKQIAERILSTSAGVPLTKITRGSVSASEAGRLASVAMGETGAQRVYVDDTPDQPAARLMALARRAVRRWGVGLVVVDYLQLMRPENADENRTQQVGMMARRLKQLARECNVPVVCLCQLNRQVENRPGGSKPRLADLRESGEIEAHADSVILLSPQPNQSDGDDVWLIDATIAKNRHGPVGDVTLAYRRSCVRFENVARGYESDRYAA